MKTALVLGASGRFGRNMAIALRARGWAVRNFRRGEDRLEDATRGVALIVNAWNPPYPRWASEVPQLHADVRRIARATGATVLIPGNVYGFGQQPQMPWREGTSQLATGSLGRIRLEMERAYERDGVRTIILRAGDFIDTEMSDNWLDRVILSKLAKGRVIWPGDPDVPHAWAYLPDMARAAVVLVENSANLDTFSTVHFPGYTLSGREIGELAGAALGTSLELRRMAWWPLQIARPVWPMARYLLQMRYLWSLPHALASDRFDNLLPGFQSTPPEAAIAAAVAAIEGKAMSAQTRPWRPASGPDGQTIPASVTIRLDEGKT